MFCVSGARLIVGNYVPCIGADARSRLCLGISGDDFLERMNAGTLPDEPGTEHLVMLARALPETAA